MLRRQGLQGYADVQTGKADWFGLGSILRHFKNKKYVLVAVLGYPRRSIVQIFRAIMEDRRFGNCRGMMEENVSFSLLMAVQPTERFRLLYGALVEVNESFGGAPGSLHACLGYVRAGRADRPA